MFRAMRRKQQILSQKESIEILEKNTSGVLAVLGDDRYPYAVPLSYCYVNNSIYFHCAKSGHKLDAILKHDRVSFCVIDQDKIVPEKYTTYYRSVIVFGRAFVIGDIQEKRAAIEAIAAKYSPNLPEGRQKEIETAFDRVCLVKLTIEHLSGKEAIELKKQKEK